MDGWSIWLQWQTDDQAPAEPPFPGRPPQAQKPGRHDPPGPRTGQARTRRDGARPAMTRRGQKYLYLGTLYICTYAYTVHTTYVHVCTRTKYLGTSIAAGIIDQCTSTYLDDCPGQLVRTTFHVEVHITEAHYMYYICMYCTSYIHGVLCTSTSARAQQHAGLRIEGIQYVHITLGTTAHADATSLVLLRCFPIHGTWSVSIAGTA